MPDVTAPAKVVVTDVDYEAFCRVVAKAYERFPTVHEKLTRDTSAEASYRHCQPANIFEIATVDEEGSIVFIGYDREGEQYQSLFGHNFLYGDDDEFKSYLAEKVKGRDLKRREDRRTAEEALAAAEKRSAELRAQAEAAERERIFREECAARGVDPIPPTDYVARRRRKISEMPVWKVDDEQAFARYVHYGDLTDVPEPWYSELLKWEKREGLAN